MLADMRIQEILLQGGRRGTHKRELEQTARQAYQDGRFDSTDMTPKKIKERMEQSTQASRSKRAVRNRTPNRVPYEGDEPLARDIFSRGTIKNQARSDKRPNINRIHFATGLLLIVFLVWLFSSGSSNTHPSTIETSQYDQPSTPQSKQYSVISERAIQNHLYRLIDLVRMTGNLPISQLQQEIARRLSGHLYDQYYQKLLQMLEKQGSLEIKGGMIGLTPEWWVHYST